MSNDIFSLTPQYITDVIISFYATSNLVDFVSLSACFIHFSVYFGVQL